ncbi:hypothetical protein UFOVP1349_27 [uncultured Caudovirales phage]|uniref:Uncharacterized protein n=1 Tax=uncultured Caudovirales phage TaxID=2100421 RepID=A0A6J5S146_9CAUD|nr:hypothetical protein UFOVP925_16 [uncultured Caudovirales phage]CAB4184180.1 hypothetical protein UFOVP1097_33 [uncultured Caudovirales phage]CAB4200084.1 hypothetical protein UFOVP1349_27 [uncultured Caudovirales phage]CAB4213975.1 hypothetical protein UFOVP1456_7 [uncultured Caudovirales phage]
MRKVPDNEVKPGMIIELKDEPGKKYEVLSANGAEKQLIRREDLDEPGEHFVEVVMDGRHSVTVYRFYGVGVWRVKRGENWHPINAILVPGEALEIAARECRADAVT